MGGNETPSAAPLAKWGRCPTCHRRHAYDEVSGVNVFRPHLSGSQPCGTKQAKASEDAPTCPSCGAPTWDGLHRNGHRDCLMSEVPGA